MAAGSTLKRRLAQHRRRQHPSHELLAHTLGARQQQGMGKPPLGHQPAQLFLLPPMPKDLFPLDMKMPFLWLCHFLCCQITSPYI